MFGLKTPAVATIVILALTTLGQAQGGPPDGWHRGPGMMWSYGGGFGMLFGFFFMILILAAVAIGILLLLRALGFMEAAGRSPNTDRALDILKERFAKGEIDAKEFDERKRHLAD